MRKFFKFFLSISLLLVLVLAVVIVSNYSYLQRVYASLRIDAVLDASWFEPTVDLAPAENITELVRSENLLKTQTSRFSDAIAYAESMDSSVLLAWQNGELVLEKYWDGFDETSYYQTHSVHKSLLALAVGMAVVDGSIDSIQDPVSDYIGEWIEQPLGKITVENLLTMTAGLESPSFSPIPFSYSSRLLNGSDISSVAREMPQTSAPGTLFHYANGVPQIMLDVLEAATDEPYEEYLETKLWSKFAANSGRLWMDREGGSPRGYCCLISRAEDLLRLGLLILNEGKVGDQQVVERNWIRAMTSPSAQNPNYGYYAWLGSPHTPMRTYSPGASFGVAHSEPYLADDVIFFDGFGGQRVYIVPSQQLVIVRVGKTRFDFDDAILPNRIIASLNQTPPIPSTGTFEVSHTELSMLVAEGSEAERSVNLQVSYPLGDGDFPLIVFSHGHFLNNLSYRNLTDYWVSAGYVVVAPLHIDTGEMSVVSALTEEVGSDWVKASRLLDMAGTINQIESLISTIDTFNGRILTNRVIAAGHSFGALSSQHLAGASPEYQGNAIYPIPGELANDRVAAVVAISPPGLMTDYLSEATWQGFSAPQLVVTGTQDFFPQIWPSFEAHFVSYLTAEPGDNYLLVLDGMDHYLGNLIGRLERDDPPQTVALQNLSEVSLAFINHYLINSEETSRQLNSFEQISQRSGVLQYEHR